MSTIEGWIKHTGQAEIWVARSPMMILSQHYVMRYRSSARCMAPGSCLLCEKDYPRLDVAVLAVSQQGRDLVRLLRFTPSQAHLIQGLQTMGQHLIGKVLQVQGQGSRTLGAIVVDRTVTTAAPIEKYLSAIGQKLYDRCVRDELKGMNKPEDLEDFG